MLNTTMRVLCSAVSTQIWFESPFYELPLIVQVLEVFCHDPGCLKAVCLSCAVSSHNGHRTEFLGGAIVSIKVWGLFLC